MKRVSRAYCCLSHSESSRGHQSLDIRSEVHEQQEGEVWWQSPPTAAEPQGSPPWEEVSQMWMEGIGRKREEAWGNVFRGEEQSPFDPESCIPEHELIPKCETC